MFGVTGEWAVLEKRVRHQDERRESMRSQRYSNAMN